MWYKIVGLLFLLGSLVFIREEFKRIEVSKTGKIVSVEIISKDCGNYRGRNFFTFRYNDKHYSHKCGNAYCRDLIIGEYAEMRVNNDATMFQYPNENQAIDIISWMIIGVFGVFLILRKK